MLRLNLLDSHRRLLVDLNGGWYAGEFDCATLDAVILAGFALVDQAGRVHVQGGLDLAPLLRALHRVQREGPRLATNGLLSDGASDESACVHFQLISTQQVD